MYFWFLNNVFINIYKSGNIWISLKVSFSLSLSIEGQRKILNNPIFHDYNIY